MSLSPYIKGVLQSCKQQITFIKVVD